MTTTYVACSDLETRTLRWAPRTIHGTVYSLTSPETVMTLTAVQVAKICRHGVTIG